MWNGGTGLDGGTRKVRRVRVWAAEEEEGIVYL
jgi:hypothetical protein